MAKTIQGTYVTIDPDYNMPNFIKGTSSSVTSTGRNEKLDRESKGCSSVLFYMTLYINIDVWKQVTTYGIKYYNGGEYPVPQTFIVTVTELMKLVIFLVIAAQDGSLIQIKLSMWYAVPSIIYAVNNNIYLLALHYTTPPIWNIIIQMRIFVTALTYRVVFRRAITPLQWVALAMLVVAIVMTHFTTNEISGSYGNLTIPLLLAAVGSITSCLASFTMEYLFKNDSRSFSEMQVQLYFFGSLSCAALYGIETRKQHNETPLAASHWVWFLLLACIITSSLTGVAVAIIVKRLDNIVKLYTQALSNMATSIACTLFFPEDFILSIHFLSCLILILFAIFLYESKSISWEICLERSCRRFSRVGVQQLALFVLLGFCGAVILFIAF